MLCFDPPRPYDCLQSLSSSLLQTDDNKSSNLLISQEMERTLRRNQGDMLGTGFWNDELASPLALPWDASAYCTRTLALQKSSSATKFEGHKRGSFGAGDGRGPLSPIRELAESKSQIDLPHHRGSGLEQTSIFAPIPDSPTPHFKPNQSTDTQRSTVLNDNLAMQASVMFDTSPLRGDGAPKSVPRVAMFGHTLVAAKSHARTLCDESADAFKARDRRSALRKADEALRIFEGKGDSTAQAHEHAKGQGMQKKQNDYRVWTLSTDVEGLFPYVPEAHAAATKILYCWKAHLFYEHRRARDVQRFWKGYRVRRDLYERTLYMNACALTVQCLARRFIARMLVWKIMAIRVQALMRG